MPNYVLTVKKEQSSEIHVVTGARKGLTLTTLVQMPPEMPAALGLRTTQLTNERKAPAVCPIGAGA